MTLQELAMFVSTRNAYLVIRLNPFTIVCCSGVLGERMRVAETLKEWYWKLPSLSLKRALESWQALEPRVNACISRLVELKSLPIPIRVPSDLHTSRRIVVNHDGGTSTRTGPAGVDP